MYFFVLFYVLFGCICVLNYCHRVATQLQLNISYHLKFILFWNNTLHVSDSLSVHRQDSKTVHTASGICHTGSVADIQAYLMLYVQS